MIRTHLPSTLAALVFCGLAMTTPAQVIDDFEQGTFSLAGSSFDSGTQSFLLPIHCISEQRVDRLYVNGNPSGATLSLGAVDDEVTTVWGDGGGRLEFDYAIDTGAGADLGFAGTANALRVHLTVAVPAGELKIALRDGGGASGILSRSIFGAGSYSFPLANFPGVDTGNVVFIQLILEVPDFGDYHIADFRAWYDPAAAAGMDVTTGNAAGPPYPTAPIQVETTVEDPESGSVLPLGFVNFALNDLSDHGTIHPGELVANDSGGGIGMPGEQVGIIIVETMPQKASTHYRGGSASWWIEPAEGFETMIVGSPRLVPEDLSSSQWFEIQLTTEQRDGDGILRARCDYTLGFEVPDASNLVFTKAGVEPTPFEGAGFLVDFELSENGMAADAAKAGTPLVEIQMRASALGFAPTAISNTIVSDPLRLRAQPSVMGASTQLWMSHPLAVELRLQLFDLAGRAIRTLSVPAGQEFAAWDGRDARGANVGSGVYLVRALDAPQAKPIKILKLR